MTAMALEPKTQEDILLEGFLALDTPEGFRAELIDGEIVVTPPPGGFHEKIAGKIAFAIARHAKIELDYAANRGVRVPKGSRCTKSLVIPDSTYAPSELDLFASDDSWTDPDGILLVVEVTSTRPEIDRGAKRHCYARAGIPHYLLADRVEKKVTLFSEPEDEDYHSASWVPFGKPLVMPKPFDFELDTKGFD
jgi:Uma2 family endonuclease